MKRRRPKRPSSLSNEEKCNFKPWQTVYVDTSGKWRSKSSRSNHYHTVFICVRSDFNLTFPHKKRSHFPLVYMKFVARIGSHPQHLISDKEDEINSKKFNLLLLTKVCQHICLPKGEHYSLGVPEKAILDLDSNTRPVMNDANIPQMYRYCEATCCTIEHLHVTCYMWSIDYNFWDWHRCCSWSLCVSTVRVLLHTLPRENREEMSKWMHKTNLEYFQVWPPGEYVW